MLIVIGSDTICDGADRSLNKNAGPSDYVMEGDLGAQVAEFLRAEDASVFNRKNRRANLTFGVKRQCASEAAAESFATLYPWTVTRSGTLTVTTSSGSLRMLTAVINKVRCTYIGATVKIAFQITGGKVEVVP